jgi:hypothetical protein
MREKGARVREGEERRRGGGLTRERARAPVGRREEGVAENIFIMATFAAVWLCNMILLMRLKGTVVTGPAVGGGGP